MHRKCEGADSGARNPSVGAQRNPPIVFVDDPVRRRAAPSFCVSYLCLPFVLRCFYREFPGGRCGSKQVFGSMMRQRKPRGRGSARSVDCPWKTPRRALVALLDREDPIAVRYAVRQRDPGSPFPPTDCSPCASGGGGGWTTPGCCWRTADRRFNDWTQLHDHSR
jgi:hypothetical protein